MDEGERDVYKWDARKGLLRVTRAITSETSGNMDASERDDHKWDTRESWKRVKETITSGTSESHR